MILSCHIWKARSCWWSNDAVAFARRVGAPKTLLIHMCHDIGLHEQVNSILPEGIDLAYDGQIVTL